MNPVDEGETKGGPDPGSGRNPSVDESPADGSDAEVEDQHSEQEPVAIVREDSGLRIKRGFVDFLAIFLGVSLSFLAEDWREDLNEVEDGLRSLQGIVADINQDLPTAQALARIDSTALVRGLWLHQNWERDDLPEDSVDAALQALHSGSPYTPVRSEYESAKYAGRLQYLENQELRQDITQLYESSQPLLVHVYDLRTDFTLELWRLLRPYESYRTTFEGGNTVPPVHLQADWPELRSNNSLRNALVESISLRRVFMNLLRSHVRQSVRLREAIRAELVAAGMAVPGDTLEGPTAGESAAVGGEEEAAPGGEEGTVPGGEEGVAPGGENRPPEPPGRQEEGS